MRFLGRRKDKEPETKNVRHIGDPTISVVEGLDGKVAITVSGWNPENAIDMFDKVYARVKKK